MLIGCPKCKTRYRVADEKIGTDGIKLRCSTCQTIFRVKKPAAPAPASAAPTFTQTPVSPSPATKPTASLVVAHENPAFCDAIREVLAGEPFSIITINDGNDAAIVIRNQRPQIALIDVGLPGKFGFEVCEELKKNPATAGTKILLIASVHDGSRYKRTPESLYGADDYIEKHRIPDDLVTKIYRLLDAANAPVQPSAPAPLLAPAKSAVEPDLPQKEQTAPHLPERPEPPPAAPAPEPELSEDHVKAKRLARIIASDIALYNMAKVEEGVRNGTFYELLADVLQEGTALYHRRVAEDIRATTRYLHEALENLIDKKKRELNLH